MKLSLTQFATLEESVSLLKWIVVIQANILVILFADGDILGSNAGRFTSILFEFAAYIFVLYSYFLILLGRSRFWLRAVLAHMQLGIFIWILTV